MPMVPVPAKVQSSIATRQTTMVPAESGVAARKGIAQRTQLSEHQTLGVSVSAKVERSIVP